MSKPCIFCNPRPREVLLENDLVRVVWDSYPVSEGHALVVPKRHVGSLFEATPEEQMAVMEALAWTGPEIKRRFSLDGFTIGINDGPAAGQSIPHCHVHVIPRRAGDVEDPRGGVRWVVPDRAAYWRKTSAA